MRDRRLFIGKRMAMDFWLTTLFIISIATLLSLAGCSGGSSGGGNDNDQPSGSQQEEWQTRNLLNLDSGGTVMPNVKAVQASDGRIHLIYFSDAPPDGDNLIYTLNYLIWDPVERLLVQQNPKPQGPAAGIEGLDNSRPAALALNGEDKPVIAYQGGNFRPMGEEQQSDVMISLIENVEWAEYTAAIGYIERNPLYDGLARSDLDLAVDSSGNIHICFQFFYEGVDADNMRYPDVLYVQKNLFDLGPPADDAQWAVEEETVHGNDFSADFGIHNSVGYYCNIVLDSAGQPVVIYAEHTEIVGSSAYVLWAARRNGPDDWQREVIDQFDENWRVNAVSAAVSPIDGAVAVAYQLKYTGSAADQGDHLRFSRQVDGGWSEPLIVDQSSWCGDDAALAFDESGRAAIAYYDRRSHSGNIRRNLRLARFDGTVWQTETVSEAEDIGQYNSVWFDAGQQINICSYSKSDDAIFIFSKTENN